MTITNRTKACLARIASDDPHLRAFIRVDQDDALAAAAESDRRHEARQTLSALDGLLVAVKDNLAMAGKPWTAGIAGRRDLLAKSDAAAVTKLRSAGAVLIGGANMEEAALGAVTDNPIFGRCMNPLGDDLTPGGSSGGSAVAVAAGFADLALGTDTMGSVRVPAAYCGLAGIKPTFGAIDRDGLAFLCRSLDTIGPMARDVGLLWPALNALANDTAKAAWAKSPKPGVEGLRIGIPAEIRSVDCQDEILAGLSRGAHTLQEMGAVVTDVSLEGWDPGKSRRAGLLITEVEGAQELSYLIDRPGAISDHLRSLLVYGRDARLEKVAAAREEIRSAGQALDQAWTMVDAVLLPTAPQQAFPHETPAPANQADLTALANFAHCPAVALPVALAGKLPASVQLVSQRWSDPALLAWAAALAPRLV